MQAILGISCGLDVHKDTIEACILIANGTGEPEVIQEPFTTMRGDILRLRDWLIRHKCLNVAMESTGVYWKPIYTILEEVEGINLCLVNSYHMRNVPGRKNDEDDAEWIASLFMCGLLNKSFVPERGVRNLREYTRFHVKLIQSKVRIVNRIEKLLQTHGFKLSSVLSSIVGVSSLRILEKLSEKGEVGILDVEIALERGVKKTSEEIAYAINGRLPKSSQMLLRLMLDILYSYNRQIEAVYKEMLCVAHPYMTFITLLATIPGIDILSATYIIAEIGVDLSHFKKGSASLAKWAGLSPRGDISAGKIKSDKILKGNSYIKSILCQCAWAATKTRNTRASNWYWRNVHRLGEKTAIIAVARRLLVYAYNIITTEKSYDEQLDMADTEKIKAFKLAAAKRQISMLGDDNDNSGLNVVEDKNDLKTNMDGKQSTRLRGKNNKGIKSPNSSPCDFSGADLPVPSIISDEAPTQSDLPNTEASKPKKRGRPKKNPTIS